MSMRLQNQVKTTPTPSFTHTRTGLLQRKCACGGSPGMAGECAECRNKKPTLQRRSTNQTEPTTVPPIVHDVLRSPSQPLDANTRAFMEPRFGHDFSQVRVHNDAQAAESARAVNALAYTVGQDVVFGAGKYQPETSRGNELLAHELTHVVQQASAAPTMQEELEIGARGSQAERDLDDMARHLIAATPAQSIRSESPVLRRQNVVLQRAGFGEVRVAEARLEEEERIKKGCPVKDKGTLSEVSWGETSGLYPTKDNKYTPDKWDTGKTCELLRMRGAVHTVGQRGESVHKAKPGDGEIEKKLKPYHFIENFLSRDPEITDPNVKWFYLGAKPDKPDTHPGTTGTTRVKTYGSFYNIGGGDVPKGDVYIHFYKLKT